MIAVTGATGYIGRAVSDALMTRGIKVVTVGRGDSAQIRWPAAGGTFDHEALDMLRRTRAVVNFAGENIGARWTRARKRAIGASRGGLTATLARAIYQGYLSQPTGRQYASASYAVTPQ